MTAAAIIDQLRSLRFKFGDQILVVADHPFTVEICPPNSKGLDKVYVNLCLKPEVVEDPNDVDDSNEILEI